MESILKMVFILGYLYMTYKWWILPNQYTKEMTDDAVIVIRFVLVPVALMLLVAVLGLG